MTSWYKPNLKLNSSLSSSQMQDSVLCNPGILLLSTRGFLKGCFKPREGVFLMPSLQPEGREGLLLLALGGKPTLMWLNATEVDINTHLAVFWRCQQIPYQKAGMENRCFARAFHHKPEALLGGTAMAHSTPETVAAGTGWTVQTKE